MILKKPYAFLIKYFKVIHFILLFLLIWFTYSSRGIFNFFNTYVKSGYQISVVTDLHNTYAPVSLITIVIVIISLTTALLVLMVHKKKPYKLYLMTILYYSLLFIGLFFVRGVLASFQDELLIATTARSLRDIILIVNIPQYVFIGYFFLRAIGFDVKKFNFASDLKEMNYSAKDAEEFELNFNFEGYKAEQKTRRLFREIVYYIKENKFVVICISVVTIIILLNTIRLRTHNNYDLSYNMNRTFIYNKLNVTFQDAMITDLDYNGNEIDGHQYLVLKVNIKNNSGSVVKIDYNNFKLEFGRQIINPTVNAAKNFVDFASNIVPTSISHLSDATFALAYELPSKDTSKVKRINIHNGVVVDKGMSIDKHIFVKLKAKEIGKVEIAGNYGLGDEIVFDKTLLGQSSIKLTSATIFKKYIYKYKDCISTDNCAYFDDMLVVSTIGNHRNNVIIVFEGEYKQDLTTEYSKTYTSINSFVDNYCSIQYRVNGEVFNDGVNITPSNAYDFIAFEVPQNIEYADLIQVVITIRNHKYFYVINK